ncbi:MAG TPA: sulfatase-like hydrolase/transferase [Pirellulales bacterium]
MQAGRSKFGFRSRLLAACVWLLIAAPGVAADAAANPPKTNFVVLLCDDLGYGDLSCFAHPTVRSPNLDKLAADGLKLTSCYSAMPVCSPSRAGLMTGRNPNRAGIADWIPPGTGVYLRKGEVTVAQLLKQAGYRTCHAGKWHLNSQFNGQETTPGDAGFDHWLATQNNAAPSHLNPNNFVRNGMKAGELTGPSSHVVVAEAIRFLEEKPGEPFFLNLWFHETHEPVAAADEFLQNYPEEENVDRKHYLGDVTQMDAAVGKLLAYLDEHNLRENTLVFFSSDNGPETLNRYKNANRSYGSPGPLRGMKLHVTEAGYRVPGIIRWPARIKPGTVSAEPVCSVDLLPTFCAIAGVSPPADLVLDGADVSPLFANAPIKRPHPLYWQYDRAISKPWTISLRDGDWKLLGNASLDKFELHHLADDLAEAKDLAASEPERVQKMAAEMKRLHAEIAVDRAKSGNPETKPGRK